MPLSVQNKALQPAVILTEVRPFGFASLPFGKFALIYTYYKSFIINLKKAKLLTNEEVLKIFDIDADVLKTNLDKQFKAYYEDEIANQIISSSVSYEEYLKAHEITDFLNEMYYDIKDGKLNVYLDYNEWTNLETENYFVGIGHVFEVE